MSRTVAGLGLLVLVVLTLAAAACSVGTRDVTWRTCEAGQTSGCGAKYGSHWNACAVEPNWAQSCDDMLFDAFSTARAEQHTKTQAEPRVEGQLADACGRAEAEATAQVAKYKDNIGVEAVKFCLTPTVVP